MAKHKRKKDERGKIKGKKERLSVANGEKYSIQYAGKNRSGLEK
jgi:hypothetical protein